MNRFMVATLRHPLPLVAAAGLVSGALARYAAHANGLSDSVFLVTLLVGGFPVLAGTVRGILHGTFAADIVASLAIAGAALTGEYAAGCVIVLMQTGGEALEGLAVRRASASLVALLARAPRIAHGRTDGGLEDVVVERVHIGDRVVVRAGEIVPVDGLVESGTARRAAGDLVPCPRALQRGERDYIGGGNFPVGLGVFYDGAKQYVYKKLNHIAIAARIKETALRRIQLPLLLSERKPDFVPKTMPY